MEGDFCRILSRCNRNLFVFLILDCMSWEFCKVSKLKMCRFFKILIICNKLDRKWVLENLPYKRIFSRFHNSHLEFLK